MYRDVQNTFPLNLNICPLKLMNRFKFDYWQRENMTAWQVCIIAYLKWFAIRVKVFYS